LFNGLKILSVFIAKSTGVNRHSAIGMVAIAVLFVCLHIACFAKITDGLFIYSTFAQAEVLTPLFNLIDPCLIVFLVMAFFAQPLDSQRLAVIMVMGLWLTLYFALIAIGRSSKSPQFYGLKNHHPRNFFRRLNASTFMGAIEFFIGSFTLIGNASVNVLLTSGAWKSLSCFMSHPKQDSQNLTTNQGECYA